MMTKERKEEIIKTYRRDDKDTGSPEVQVEDYIRWLEIEKICLTIYQKKIFKDIEI